MNEQDLIAKLEAENAQLLGELDIWRGHAEKWERRYYDLTASLRRLAEEAEAAPGHLGEGTDQ